jgi:hypothetical protein
MATLSLQIPDTIVAKLRDLAAKENVSIDEFVVATLQERAAVASQLDYLTQ